MAQSNTSERAAVRNIIKILGVGSAIGVVIVAPNSGILIDEIYKQVDKRNRQKARRAMSRLKYRSLVEVKVVAGESYYRLSQKGLARYKKMLIEELSIATPKSWDKKWRLVMFDIPKIKSTQRQTLLEKLKSLDFYMLQNSAWIHPFECAEQIGVLVSYLELDKYVSLLVVEQSNFTEHATQKFIKSGLLI